MTDLDDVIRDGLEQLAAERTPEAGDRSPEIRARVTRRRRVRRAMGAAAPIVVVGAIAAAVLWPSDDDPTHVVTDPTVTTTSVPQQDRDVASRDVPGIAVLAPGPLSPRMSPALVWVQGHLLVWGGSTEADNFPFEENADFSDGALYDIGEDRWTSIADAPFGSGQGPAVAVATDSGVVAFGGMSAATWDPTTDTWSDAGTAPGDVHEAFWTGDRVFTVERWDLDGTGGAWGAFDPATRRWTALPPAPLQLERMTVTWTGDELVALGKPLGVGFPHPARGIAYDPEVNTWRELPDAPIRVQAPTAEWNGSEVLLVDYSTEAAVYDPASNSWSVIPPMPTGSFEEGVTSVVSSGYVLVDNWMGLRTPDDRWVPVPFPDRPAFASSVGLPDGTVAVFGSHYDEESPPQNGFALIDLGVLAEARVLDLGVRIDLPAEATLVSIDVVGPGGPATVMSAELAYGPDRCTIEVHHGTSLVSTGAGTVIIEPIHGEPEWDAHRLGGSTGTGVGRGFHRIDCGSLERSIDLARYVRPTEHWDAY